jgi:Trk K+ transport system NAD-binding subunit
MRIIAVGAGGATRAVLGRLGERWEVVVIDGDRERLERTGAVRAIGTVVGDGSSRVVLERAGIRQADALLVATDDDAVALEVCRIGIEADVDRVVAVVDDPGRVAEFRSLGVVAISPDRLAARQVEIDLEPRRVASAAFAHGRAEAVEFRISPDSPLRGRLLRDLGETPWLIAAILRDDRLIVPHGSTELRENDLVTVVGAAADYGEMVAVFTGGQAHFPLHYGRNVAVAMADGEGDDPCVAEAAAFVRATAAESLLVIHDDPADLDGERADDVRAALDRLAESGVSIEPRPAAAGRGGLSALLDLVAHESVGAIVVPRPRGRFRTVRTLESVRRAGIPALLASGSFPYTGVVTPARDSVGGWRAAWTAIDLAARADLPLEALGVVPPSFVARESDAVEVRRAVARIRAEASVQAVQVNGRIGTGNPVRAFEALEPGRLVVLGIGEGRLNVLMPGMAGHIVARIRASVVVIPERDRR